MALADRRNKDQAMAARMKSLKIDRTDMRCPMCHAVIAQVKLMAHLATCGGQQKDKR